jgi:CheY-like chemotaxis protein
MSGPNGLSDRILILGDEEKSARAIQRLLAAAGYDAISVPSFESAQQELAARDVSIIIIEISASRLTDSSFSSADDDSGESLRRLHWASPRIGLLRKKSERATGLPTYRSW